MNKRYSIAEAKNHLPRLVHAVEREGAVEITRRGPKPPTPNRFLRRRIKRQTTPRTGRCQLHTNAPEVRALHQLATRRYLLSRNSVGFALCKRPHKSRHPADKGPAEQQIQHEYGGGVPMP